MGCVFDGFGTIVKVDMICIKEKRTRTCGSVSECVFCWFSLGCSFGWGFLYGSSVVLFFGVNGLVLFFSLVNLGYVFFS